LLLSPAGIISIIFDRSRRHHWIRFDFLAVTLFVTLAGVFWLLGFTGKGAMPANQNPLWAPLATLLSPRDGLIKTLWFSASRLGLHTFPWSIAALASLLRILFFRKLKKGEGGVNGTDYTLLVFILVLFFPLALAKPAHGGPLLPLVPLLAVLSAREITRWIPNFERIWSFNQIMTAVFCLLMLLLVATPLELHRRDSSPVQEMALMAGRMVPAGQTLGSFRYSGRVKSAQYLFYGEKSIDPPVTEPDRVGQLATEEPGKVFITTTESFRALHETDFHYRINILFRVSDLILFNLD